MVSKEAYYDLLIKGMVSEEAVEEFLNKPEILRKWTDEDREFFAATWLKDHGWEEVAADAPVGSVLKVKEVLELVAEKKGGNEA